MLTLVSESLLSGAQSAEVFSSLGHDISSQLKKISKIVKKFVKTAIYTVWELNCTFLIYNVVSFLIVL